MLIARCLWRAMLLQAKLHQDSLHWDCELKYSSHTTFTVLPVEIMFTFIFLVPGLFQIAAIDHKQFAALYYIRELIQKKTFVTFPFAQRSRQSGQGDLQQQWALSPKMHGLHLCSSTCKDADNLLPGAPGCGPRWHTWHLWQRLCFLWELSNTSWLGSSGVVGPPSLASSFPTSSIVK